MFKKLKEKITEEVRQSPSRISASVSQLTQAVVSPSSSSIVEPTSITDSHFTISEEVEDAAGRNDTGGPHPRGFTSVELQSDAAPPLGAVGRSRHSSVSSVVSDAFPLFEPSMFNSSFHIQSDLESNASELEDSFSSQLPTSSKEQLVAVLRKTQQRYNKYKGRYADLARHYRELERENVKAKTVLSESQDKALRRIAELKEQCALEQRAKAHLEEVLRNDLEEKDHLIMTLNTKIDLLKLNDSSEEFHCSVAPAPAPMLTTLGTSPLPSTPSLVSETLVDLSNEANHVTVGDHTETALREKVQKLEVLLVRCKDSIKLHKDKVKELSAKNDELNHQLENHEQCLLELAAARDQIQLLHKRDEEAALSLAETKRTIHSEMELKEDQIKHLRQSILSLTEQRDGAAHKCGQLQHQVTELNRLQELDISADNSRQIQELSRAKQEAVRLLQADTLHKISALQDEMVNKEQLFKVQVRELVQEKDTLATAVSALQTQLTQAEEERSRIQTNVQSVESWNRESDGKCEQLRQECLALQERAAQAEAEAARSLETTVALEKQLVEVKNVNAQIAQERDTNKVQVFELRSREVMNQYSLLEDLCRRVSVPGYGSDSETAAKGKTAPESESQLSPPLNELENSECDQHMELARHALVEPPPLHGGGEVDARALQRLDEAKRVLAAALNHRAKAVMEWQREVAALKNELSALRSKSSQELLSRTTEEEKNKRHLGDLEKMHANNVDKLKGEFATLQRTCEQYKSTLQLIQNDVSEMRTAEEAGFKQMKEEFAECLTAKEVEYSASISARELEISMLNTKLDASLVDCEKKTIEQQDLLEKISNLKIQLSTVTAEKTHLTEELCRLEGISYQNEEASLKQMKKEFDEIMQKTKDQHSVSMTSLQSEVSQLTLKLDTLMTESKAEGIVHQDLLEKFSNINQQLSTVFDEKSRIADELNLLKEARRQTEEATLKQMEQQLAECLQDSLAKDASLSLLESEISHLKSKLETSLVEHGNQAIEQQELLDKLANINQQLSSVSSEKSQLLEELNSLKVAKQNEEATYKQMEEELNESFKAKETKYCGSILSLESEILQLKTKLETSVVQHEKIAVDQHDLLENYSTLKEQLSTLSAEKSCLAEELSLLKDARSQNEEDTSMEVKQQLHDCLKDSLAKEALISSLESELSQLKAALEISLVELETRTVEQQDILIKFSNLNEQLSMVTAEKLRLMEEFSLLEARNMELVSTLEVKAKMLTKKEADNTEILEKLNQTEELSQQLFTLQQQLNTTLAEKLVLDEKLDAKTKRESEMTNLLSSLEKKIQESELLHVAEQQELANRIEEAILTTGEKDEALRKIEECHRLKIKQLAKDFDNKLHEREEELARIQEDEKVNADKTDRLQLRQLRGQLKAMKGDAHETQQLISDLRDKVTQVTEMQEQCQAECEERVIALRDTHVQELAASDKRWRQCLDQELKTQEASHKEEVNALGQEWELERKELASTGQVAVAAVKSGAGSMEAIQQQLVVMTRQLAQQRAELVELRQQHQHNTIVGLEHDGSTELEYLRNIVFQYMMGREPTVLAKVITAVLKFDPDQTEKVMQKEEVKQSLLGHLHLL